jgi:hypothetical protein
MKRTGHQLFLDSEGYIYYVAQQSGEFSFKARYFYRRLKIAGLKIRHFIILMLLFFAIRNRGLKG